VAFVQSAIHLFFQYFGILCNNGFVRACFPLCGVALSLVSLGHDVDLNLLCVVLV